MAKIVLGLASSHSPMLGSPVEDFLKHADRDVASSHHLDRAGAEVSYGELLERAPAGLEAELEPGVIERKVAACRSGIDRLADALAEVRPDVVVIVGDDQKEQFLEDNLPAMLIYSGETVENDVLPLPASAPAYWKTARSQFHEPVKRREYPVAAGLARHMTASLVQAGFDVSHSERLPRPRGEGHAYGFVHQRLMRDNIAPIVPVVLNTYYPPNQPTPRRCFALGQGLAAAVESWPEDVRVAFVASGGLSHFTVNEELDRTVMDAFLSTDGAKLGAIPKAQLNSGNSEIRNWIAVAGACTGLKAAWHDYIPCYRTHAGTGCGMGFAILR